MRIFEQGWEFALFKKRKLQIRSFHPAFPLFMPKTDERIPNPVFEVD